ncbi:MAG: nicotinate phosphoribosyltransferase [Capsulimonadaceae bacterium]
MTQSRAISSLLDTDLYKFTMNQVVFHKHPNIRVRYDFKCRNAGVDLSPYAGEIREEIAHFCSLRITAEELEYLEGIPYLSRDYVRSLRDLRLNPEAVTIETDPFTLTIEGYWYETILFEVPVLAIVNSVYFRNSQPDTDANLENGRRLLREKCRWLMDNVGDSDFHLIEFGTRRRFGAEWQQEVIAMLQRTFEGHPKIHFLGTSNVRSAMRHRLKPFGTMAHEYLQAFQALAPLHRFQSCALQGWADEYRGDLGIALSDVVGMRPFLLDFHKGFAMLYAGCRHDSGDPYEWGEDLLRHYAGFGIDPRTKTAVFSDGLDFQKALALAAHFAGRIRTQFGIGTWLTNDLGFSPLNIVIKMTECDGQPVAKLSDSPGKEMCRDTEYLAYLRSLVARRLAAG